MRFTILVFVVVGIWGFTFDWDAAKLPGLLVVFVVCSVLFAAAARAMLKIWITAEGIGSRKRPMYWNEITEMDRSTMWFLPGWQVHAVYQESVTVPDAIVAMPEFRATLERLSPPDCKIRRMISGESE